MVAGSIVGLSMALVGPVRVAAVGRPPQPAHPLWGVDTLSTITPSFIAAVDSAVGPPQFVGRYLQFGDGTNLTAGEAAQLHAEHLPILLVSAPANQRLTLAAVGQAEAVVTVIDARKLGVPKGVALYRDIESKDPISAQYLWAWTSTVASAGYVPGYYADPRPRRHGFDHAFCRAEAAHPVMGTSVAIYASQPRPHPDHYDRALAPAWDPGRPSCRADTVVWQYRENDADPNIDVDEYLPAASRWLWSPPTVATPGRQPSRKPAMTSSASMIR